MKSTFLLPSPTPTYKPHWFPFNFLTSPNLLLLLLQSFLFLSKGGLLRPQIRSDLLQLMGKVFTLKEVADHNTPKDCWLIIDGKVYDVTKFLEDHPGGDDVLLSATGKDATDDFEDVGHSTTAKSMMDEFYVGDIDSATIPSKVEYKPPNQAHYNQDKTPEFIIKILQFLVPLVILGVAVGIRFYTKSL